MRNEYIKEIRGVGMSLRLFSWAMSIDHIASPEKFVLLAMAEASDDYSNIWQGTLEGISRFTNLEIPEIRRICAYLEDQGFLVRSGLHIALAAPAYESEFKAAPSYKKKPISPARRTQVYMRDGGKCKQCGTEDDLTIDHIHPESKGGTNDLDNLQVLCRRCNCSKGVKVPK